MPTLHLMINLGSEFEVTAVDHAARVEVLTDSWCTGMWDVHHVVRYPTSNVRLYGVHFKPGGAAPFLQLPISELRNQVVPLEAIWGHRRASELRERLHSASSVQAGLGLLEQFMLERLCIVDERLGLVRRAVSEIMRREGSLRIGELSEYVGVSHNHLGTQFNRLVGLTPKELARVCRFARVLRSIDPARPLDWTRLAHQSGFYDQSHFNKDFLAFTGLTPTDFLQQRLRLGVERPGLTQVTGNMPLDDE